MRLIDADKFKEKLNYLNYELYNSHPVGELSKEEKDIVSWYIYHISKMVDNISTESAVPVEWIKRYIDGTLDEDNSQMLGFKAAIIKEMVEEWEKEDESNFQDK